MKKINFPRRFTCQFFTRRFVNCKNYVIWKQRKLDGEVDGVLKGRKCIRKSL